MENKYFSNTTFTVGCVGFFYVGVESLPMVSIIDFAKSIFGENIANPEG